MGYLLVASSYPIGTIGQPGPGVYPVVVGALFLLGAVGSAFQARAAPETEIEDWPRGAGARRIVALVAAMAIYALILRIVGHVIAGGLLAFAVMHVMEFGTRRVRAAVAIAVAAASFVLFNVLLGVQLPRGILLP